MFERERARYHSDQQLCIERESEREQVRATESDCEIFTLSGESESAFERDERDQLQSERDRRDMREAYAVQETVMFMPTER